MRLPYRTPYAVVNTDILLPRLLELICDLYEDSQGFLDHTDNAQLWYNRGYANGIIHVLRQLGYARHVANALELDGPDPIAGQETRPWGQAYRHGWELGQKETLKIIETG